MSRIVSLPQVEEKINTKFGLKGSGNIHVNGLKMNEYFKDLFINNRNKTIRESEVATSYDVKCSVKGKIIRSYRCNNFRDFKSSDFS